MQTLLTNAFWNDKTKLYAGTNNVLAFVTIISILAIVLESVDALSAYQTLFLIVEYVAVGFFSLEYIGRIISVKKPLKYVTSFLGIIDLISIVPTFFTLGNFTYLKSARAIRILQFLRSLRLLKLRRKNARNEVSVLTLEIYLFALTFSILIFGILLYVVETGQVANIPEGMLWAAKFVLGGVAQPLPETLWGDLITILGRFTGLILFGFLIAVIGRFAQKLLFGKEVEEK